MVRGWRYTKLSLSDALLFFFGMCLCYCYFMFVCRLAFLFSYSRWSFVSILVDVPLIFSCPVDHVPDWKPHILLGMVEARSVNVKNTHTNTHARAFLAKNMFTISNP